MPEMEIAAPAAAAILHGAVQLLWGMLCGVPHGRAAARRSAEAERGWRVAHTGITAGGTAILGAGAALAIIPVGGAWAWTAAGGLVLGGYAFAAALTLGAATGHRGIAPRGGTLGRAVFAGNAAGAAGTLIGGLALVGGLLFA